MRYYSLLLVILITAGCGPRSAEIDPALARMVPPDTIALVDVKAGLLRQTPLYRKHISAALESMNITDDVSEALAVSNGKDVVVFTKGKSGMLRYDSQGNRTVPPPGSGSVPPALRARLRAIAPENQVFGAGIGGALPVPGEPPGPGGLANLANLRNLFTGLEDWTLAADLRAGLKLQTRAAYKTEQDARRIHDALRGLLGIARLSTPASAPELLRLYDAVSVSMEKNTLALSAEIPAETLDKAAERLRSNPPRAFR